MNPPANAFATLSTGFCRNFKATTSRLTSRSTGGSADVRDILGGVQLGRGLPRDQSASVRSRGGIRCKPDRKSANTPGRRRDIERSRGRPWWRNRRGDGRIGLHDRRWRSGVTLPSNDGWKCGSIGGNRRTAFAVKAAPRRARASAASAIPRHVSAEFQGVAKGVSAMVAAVERTRRKRAGPMTAFGGSLIISGTLIAAGNVPRNGGAGSPATMIGFGSGAVSAAAAPASAAIETGCRLDGRIGGKGSAGGGELFEQNTSLAGIRRHRQCGDLQPCGGGWHRLRFERSRPRPGRRCPQNRLVRPAEGVNRQSPDREASAGPPPRTARQSLRCGSVAAPRRPAFLWE